jgi:hypothetical protein
MKNILLNKMQIAEQRRKTIARLWFCVWLLGSIIVVWGLWGMV